MIHGAEFKKMFPHARPLVDGETVQRGDYVRIGESFSFISPCRYDQQGMKCCVGHTVDDQPNRYYRVTEK